MLKIDACGNIKIEEVEDMLAGDDDYGTANRYSPDNRTGGDEHDMMNVRKNC